MMRQQPHLFPVDIPYLEDADFGRMVERYAYITAP